MRYSIVAASALAVGALAVPHAQLEKRLLVTEVDWELATVTVYVTVGAEPQSTSVSDSPTNPGMNREAIEAPAITDAPEPFPESDDSDELDELDESSNPIISLYRRPVRPVFSAGTWFFPTPNPAPTTLRTTNTPPVITQAPASRPATSVAPPVSRSPVVNTPPVVSRPPVVNLPPVVSTPPVVNLPPVVSTPPVVNIPPVVSTTPVVGTSPGTGTSSGPTAPLGSHISGPSQAFLASGLDYQAAILYHHNAARANHNAAPLVWNATVAATALQAANTCNFQHYIPPNVRQGQNLFTVSGSAFNVTAGITESWYKGELGAMLPYFGQANIPDEVFHDVGHLTQMLWKGTTSVGCVSIDCGTRMLVGGAPSTMNKYTVCNYWPAGNVGTQYAQNVSPPNSVSAAALGSWSD
jgi:uncharacterized protein YkwD